MKSPTVEEQLHWLRTHGYQRKLIHDKKLFFNVEIYYKVDGLIIHCMRTKAFDQEGNPAYFEWANQKLVKFRERLEKGAKKNVENIQTSSS
jgi:hypothetical protein